MTDFDIFSLFNEFIKYSNPEPRPIEEFPSYTIDQFGNIYHNEELVKQYQYDGQYNAVYLKEGSHYGKRDIHVLVAKTFIPEYYEGCVVHHIDKNKHNNRLSNLEVLDKREHARQHANSSALIEWSKTHPPMNKGKKMSDEFREHCRQSALKRVQRDKENGTYSCVFDHTFRGNQYVNADGSKKK